MQLMNELKNLEFLNGNNVVRQFIQPNLSFQEEKETNFMESTQANRNSYKSNNLDSPKIFPSKEEDIVKEIKNQPNTNRGND